MRLYREDLLPPKPIQRGTSGVAFCHLDVGKPFVPADHSVTPSREEATRRGSQAELHCGEVDCTFLRSNVPRETRRIRFASNERRKRTLSGTPCVAWTGSGPFGTFPLQVADAGRRPRHAAAAADADSSAALLTAHVEAPVVAAPKAIRRTNL